MSFRLEITLPKLGIAEPFIKLLDSKMTKVNKEISNRLQRDIKEVHNYTHRTRNLRNATTAKGKITDKPNGLVISVNQGKAPYAKYVIDGHGTWQGDQYLDEALERNKDWIESRVNKVINEAVREFNTK